MSSSSSISTSTVNGTTRLTGLSSGIDVDGIVEQLTTAEKAKKLNKLQQKVQTAEWKQEAYRSIITDMQDFSSKYFDTTSSSSIMTASNFLKYSSSSSESAVSVTAASTSSAGSHTVSVSQLATKATLTSDGNVSKNVQGSTTADYNTLTDESFVMTLDGTAYTVDLDSVSSLTTLQTAIDNAVGSGKVTVSTNTSGYLEITATDPGVQKIIVSATSKSDNGLTDLGFGTGAVLSNRLDTSATLETIASQLNSSTALTYNGDGEIELTINGTTKSFDKTDTLADMMSEINKADLGVTMAYNSITGELTMTADKTGAGNSLVVKDSGSSNFAALLLTESTAGKDALLTVDGQALTRSTNSVTVDGVTYTLNQVTTTTASNTTATVSTTGNTAGYANSNVNVSSGLTAGNYTLTVTGTSGAYNVTLSDGTNTYTSTTSATDGSATFTTSSGTVTLTAPTALSTGSTTFTVASNTTTTDDPATITVSQDTDGVYDLISNFVDAYNTLIDTLNTAVDENADSDYPPLTDDEKADMSDDEITAWEKKAKVGLLENDSTLQSVLSDMRSALIDSVSGLTTSLSSIGITSGTYDEKGTLYIDEDTLKSAIASDPEAVMDLFTQQATSKTSSGTSLSGTTVVRTLSSKELSTRYKEEGIGYRFYDILQKNISTIRDSAGNKGTLLVEAGTEEDASDTNNTLTKLINKYNDEIDDEEDRLDDYEDRMYDKYSQLETYINSMNSQLSSLTSLTSS